MEVNSEIPGTYSSKDDTHDEPELNMTNDHLYRVTTSQKRNQEYNHDKWNEMKGMNSTDRSIVAKNNVHFHYQENPN